MKATPRGASWYPKDKDINALASFKYYKSHNETFATSAPASLDDNAGRLGLKLSGQCSMSVSALEAYEKVSRLLTRILSHADIFSFAAYKLLSQKEMDAKFLEQILNSLSIAIKDSIGVASLLAVGFQHARRDAAIAAAPGSLDDSSKKALREVPITSKSLFGGQIDDIYKSNCEANRDKLVDKAVASQLKAQSPSRAAKRPHKPSKESAPQKPASSAGTDSKPTSQSNRGSRGGSSYRGFRSRGRGAHSRGGASVAKKQ